MEFDNIHQILRDLYNDMMPLCGDLIGVAKGIAGIGALLYVASRVWQSIARAEQIDVYPLLRPFAIGICIMFFPTLVLGTINSILNPVVQGAHGILGQQTLDMRTLAETKDKLEIEQKKRNKETAYLVDQNEFDKKLEELGIMDTPEMAGMYIERAFYDMKKWFQSLFRSFLETLFNAAALIIDVIRTFFLIVLAILGPIAFAISVFDGFQSTLIQWLTRYVGVYMWLPVSDLFSSIMARLQVRMLESDIARMQADPAYSLDASDGVYVVFLLIGIVGFFTIPTVAGWIIQAGGMGNFGKNVNQSASKTASMAGAGAGAAGGNITGRLKGGGSSGNSSSGSGGGNGSQPQGRNYSTGRQPDSSRTP
ncbi:conjugative transposon protein TraJ [Dysgonomonas sp. Marseille-P4677]|uniref:conjugative transposon protein TraJ n=1 Tax=Dysgonomonas sp. Marseille-P4677 TaxID=2364790 RepID=UPI001913A2CC|nr:conjugative transposon protein TraJ [Dysgonomonas sp. Marseille-P4677]MBK5719561.1 conjugative transposon protein TraJ [Dysgonomonas sp. Marseille-P4677]